MQNKGLVNIPVFYDQTDLTDLLGITNISISELGTLLCKMMDLSEINPLDLKYIEALSKERTSMDQG